VTLCPGTEADKLHSQQKKGEKRGILEKRGKGAFRDKTTSGESPSCGGAASFFGGRSSQAQGEGEPVA